MKNKNLSHAAAAVCGLAALPTLFGGDLIVNGGFETGNFTGWTRGGDYHLTDVTFSVPLETHTGTGAAVLGTDLGTAAIAGSLGQSISPSPGETYTFSFWLRNNDGAAEFHAYWNGTELLSLHPDGAFVWTPYSFTVVGPATFSDPTLFVFKNSTDFLYLDDVSLTAVPEPAALAGAAVMGLSAISFVIRRRRS